MKRKSTSFYVSPAVVVSSVVGALCVYIVNIHPAQMIDSVIRMTSSIQGATHEKPLEASSEPAAGLWQEV